MLKNNLDFKHIDKIIKKGLKNDDYYKVLGIIGESEEPLNNIQILHNFEKKYPGESTKYIYEILKEFSPLSEDIPDNRLFIWEDIKALELEQLKEKCTKILKKINLLFDFKIDNHLNENYLILMNGKTLNESSKWIKIEKNDKKSLNYNPDFNDGILISICSKSNHQILPTLTIKGKGKQLVYTKSYSILERRRFLDITSKKYTSFLYRPGKKIDEKTMPKQHKLWKDITDIGWSLRGRTGINLQKSFLKQNNGIEKEKFFDSEKFYDLKQVKKDIRIKAEELNRIMNDRENFSYSLKFRGLLLFLILSVSSKKSRTDKLLFSNVLSNPSIVKIAPFLKYLNEFEELGFKGKELIVTIAEELRNQLHLDIPDGNFLLERTIERYYKEFQKYFLFIEAPSLYLSIIKDFEKNIVSLLKNSIKNKQLVLSFSLKDFDFSL